VPAKINAPPAPRLIGAAQLREFGDQEPNKAIELARERREKVVRPLLDAKLNGKGWSDHRWAIEAGKAAGREINPNVVYDYLAGRSFPQRRHEVPLAEVIGLKKLPK
jgi:hypothetical protein